MEKELKRGRTVTNTDMLKIAMEQHAIDMNCLAEDFTKNENVVVISKENSNARKYLNLPSFCSMVSYGNNIVSSVDERMFDFINMYTDTKDRYKCFTTPQLNQLMCETAKYGYMPYFQAEYWLPDVNEMKVIPTKYETRILEPNDFSELYKEEWSNALSSKRPQLDVLGVGAYDNGRLVGLAACSADCDSMWQIGIDVLPEYRRQGIATALTSKLAVEILERGKVPFYSCSWANLASVGNAIKSGLRPTWIEISTAKTEEALSWSKNIHFKDKYSDVEEFFLMVDRIVGESKIVIDRPKGTRHPKIESIVYPLDYGYLEDTTSMDGGGIDLYKGTNGEVIDAVILTVDLIKRDSEVKILIGCSETEKLLALHFHNDNEYMKGILIRR